MDNLVDDVQVDFLGFCACGRPEENLKYILDGLILIDEKKYSPDYHIDREVFDVWWEDYNKRVHDFFKSKDAEYFFYYWADKEGLTEHGGSVPGWLDDKGYELIEKIKSLDI